MHAYTVLCDTSNRANCNLHLAMILQQLVHQPGVHTVCAAHADAASQGIKVTDADSKKKAIKLLKAEQAMKQMDIDSDASDSGSDAEMK